MDLLGKGIPGCFSFPIKSLGNYSSKITNRHKGILRKQNNNSWRGLFTPLCRHVTNNFSQVESNIEDMMVQSYRFTTKEKKVISGFESCDPKVLGYDLILLAN